MIEEKSSNQSTMSQRINLTEKIEKKAEAIREVKARMLSLEDEAKELGNKWKDLRRESNEIDRKMRQVAQEQSDAYYKHKIKNHTMLLIMLRLFCKFVCMFVLRYSEMRRLRFKELALIEDKHYFQKEFKKQVGTDTGLENELQNYFDVTQFDEKARLEFDMRKRKHFEQTQGPETKQRRLEQYNKNRRLVEDAECPVCLHVTETSN